MGQTQIPNPDPNANPYPGQAKYYLITGEMISGVEVCRNPNPNLNPKPNLNPNPKLDKHEHFF